MTEFYVTQIKVVDGYPELEQIKIDTDEAMVRHFMDMVYRATPREEWDALHDMITGWSYSAQNKELMFPGGSWTINLGGDKVRAAPELKEKTND